MILQRYTFGSKSQLDGAIAYEIVVAYDIAKIYIWKQITTVFLFIEEITLLLMILQRYTFGSKSQPHRLRVLVIRCCLWYCKDIHLEANHNILWCDVVADFVAYDIAKIYIWKQITTQFCTVIINCKLLMILQRYTFGSKSQLILLSISHSLCCLWYCKDIHLEANHNATDEAVRRYFVAYDIAKIYIWKQITTRYGYQVLRILLLMILQRYTFGSKSQL